MLSHRINDLLWSRDRVTDSVTGYTRVSNPSSPSIIYGGSIIAIAILQCEAALFLREIPQYKVEACRTIRLQQTLRYSKVARR